MRSVVGSRPDHLEHPRELVAARVVVQDRGYLLQLAEPAVARGTRPRVEALDPQQGARVDPVVILRSQREEEVVVRLEEVPDSPWVVVCQPVAEVRPRWGEVAAVDRVPQARAVCAGVG